MKKDKYRFTLRFCEVSPKQITATDVLIAAGRRKASLIADLIDEHIKKYGADAFAGYFHSQAVQFAADIEARPTATTVKPIKAAAIDEVDEVSKISKDSTSEEPLNDEACNSILEGLSMFKVQ